MSLICQMVMKNEADRYLIPVLDEINKVADKIVITDDGSTDNSVEVAERYTELIYQNDESLFAENEGHLRQRAWHNLDNHAKPGDWILCIDADEIIHFDKLKVPLYRWLTQTRYDVLGIKFFHMWNETQFRVDKAWTPNIGSRLFKYQEGGTFSDRKLACGSEPTYIQMMIRRRRFMVDPGIHIQHMGYVLDEDKAMKHERYMKLDHGDYHSLAHIESIMDPHPQLFDWESR